MHNDALKGLFAFLVIPYYFFFISTKQTVMNVVFLHVKITVLVTILLDRTTVIVQLDGKAKFVIQIIKRQ